MTNSQIRKEINFHRARAKSYAMSSDREMEEYHLSEVEKLEKLLKEKDKWDGNN